MLRFFFLAFFLAAPLLASDEEDFLALERFPPEIAVHIVTFIPRDSTQIKLVNQYWRQLFYWAHHEHLRAHLLKNCTSTQELEGRLKQLELFGVEEIWLYEHPFLGANTQGTEFLLGCNTLYACKPLCDIQEECRQDMLTLKNEYPNAFEPPRPVSFLPLDEERYALIVKKLAKNPNVRALKIGRLSGGLNDTLLGFLRFFTHLKSLEADILTADTVGTKVNTYLGCPQLEHLRMVMWPTSNRLSPDEAQALRWTQEDMDKLEGLSRLESLHLEGPNRDLYVNVGLFPTNLGPERLTFTPAMQKLFRRLRHLSLTHTQIDFNNMPQDNHIENLKECIEYGFMHREHIEIDNHLPEIKNIYILTGGIMHTWTMLSHIEIFNTPPSLFFNREIINHLQNIKALKLRYIKSLGSREEKNLIFDALKNLKNLKHLDLSDYMPIFTAKNRPLYGHFYELIKEIESNRHAGPLSDLETLKVCNHKIDIKNMPEAVKKLENWFPRLNHLSIKQVAIDPQKLSDTQPQWRLIEFIWKRNPSGEDTNASSPLVLVECKRCHVSENIPAPE